MVHREIGLEFKKTIHGGIHEKVSEGILLSPEELQELEEWFREQDKCGGLNGEPAVWG